MKIAVIAFTTLVGLLAFAFLTSDHHDVAGVWDGNGSNNMFPMGHTPQANDPYRTEGFEKIAKEAEGYCNYGSYGIAVMDYWTQPKPHKLIVINKRTSLSGEGELVRPKFHPVDVTKVHGIIME